MSPKKVNVKERLNSDGEIDLSMLEIQDVPVKDIALLKKGTTLNLYNNQISKLPKNFPSLTHIVKLDLSKNCLVELPENFGDLIKLKHLDLYQNQLTKLPLSFSKLKALKWLDLKENPLEPTLTKVAGPCENTKQCQTCAKNVISYLSRQYNRYEAEQEEKENVRKRQLELNEMKKKNEKKLKKTENNSMKNGTTKPVTEPIQVLTKTEKKKLKKLKKLGETKTSRFPSLLSIFTFVFLSIFILTSVKVPYLVPLEKAFTDFYFKAVGMLPENYQKYGVVFSEHFNSFHAKTGSFVLKSIDFFRTNENCVHIYDCCKKFISNIQLKIQDLYNNFMS